MLRVLCEKGIAFEFSEGLGWSILSSKFPLAIGDPEKSAAGYGARPIVFAQDIQGDGLRTYFLPLSPGKSPFELQPSELTQLIFTRWNSPILPHVVNMNYVLGSVIYHCKKLAESYAKITEEYKTSIHLHDEEKPSDPSSEQYTAGNRAAPFYEIEALITSVRRAYDSMRYILWQSFGENKGSTPSSFADTLKVCNGLPGPLMERLDKSWEGFGKRATDYRDCIIHYLPIGGGWSNVKMERLSGGIWTCIALLPDNPEVRSAKQFTYKLQVDALTYGWELANEIVDVAYELIEATPDLRPWADKIQPD